MPRASHIPRREGLLLAALLVLGFGFRAWDLENAGVDHFDEGVYVFSALGVSDPSQPHRLYPKQARFSPPLFFGLVGVASALGMPPDRAAILLNVLLGTLTIACIWWVGRAWFGAAAGVAAAALLAFNEFHIALSRTALTDVTFALAFLLALAAIAAAVRRRRSVLAVAAGLAVGLAWNTKYHGWFALLVAAAAWLGFIWSRREAGRSWMRALRLWGLMAAVAAVSFLPWGLFIQAQPGGYADLAAYQRTLLSPEWLTNLGRQAQMQLFMEGPLSRASGLVALLCALLLSGPRSRPTSKFLLILLLLCTTALAVGGSGAATLLALLAIPALVRKPAAFPGWLVASWLTFWILVTPLYRPYARLVLPFTLAACLAAGLWLSGAMAEGGLRVKRTAWRPALAALSALAVLGIAAVLPDPSNPWRPSRSLPQAASQMQDLIPPRSRVLAVGEPSLAFYLHLGDRPASDRLETLGGWDSLRTPMYIVTGVYAKRAPKLRERLERLGDQLVFLGTFPMSPKDIRVLDDFSPRQARLFRAHPDRTYELTLYRFSPKARGAFGREPARSTGVGYHRPPRGGPYGARSS